MNKKVLKMDARAKINLTLDILGKRKDGFHQVSMIMQSIALCDTIILELTESGGICLVGDVPGVLKPEDNLMYRAAKLLSEHYGIDLNCKMTLQKRIPVAAGLAGGSADAGAVLLGLNKLLDLNRPIEELLELGAKLGSDIPFTMVGGTMLATGRGEKLSPCSSNLKAGIVLVKLMLNISTSWAYSKYKKYINKLNQPNQSAMLGALQYGDLEAVNASLENVFEQIMLREIPEINIVKDIFTKLGYKSLMSGSGPTVFALVKDKNEAKELARKLKRELVDCEIIASELVNA